MDIYIRTKNYEHYNAHPQNKSVGDCVVRAICTAMDKDYSETRKELNRAKKSLGFQSYKDHDFLRKYMESLGYETIKFKSETGVPRTKLYEFLNEHQTGAYVVAVRHHASCIKDGKLLDTWDCGYLTIYGAWKIR